MISCFLFRDTKIVLKGDNSAHLFDLEDLAKKAHIPHYLVHDAGKTQVNAMLVYSQFTQLEIQAK